MAILPLRNELKGGCSSIYACVEAFLLREHLLPNLQEPHFFPRASKESCGFLQTVRETAYHMVEV